MAYVAQKRGRKTKVPVNYFGALWFLLIIISARISEEIIDMKKLLRMFKSQFLIVQERTLNCFFGICSMQITQVLVER